MPADERPLSRWSRRKAAMRSRGGAAPVIADAPSTVPESTGDVAVSAEKAAFALAGQESEITPAPAPADDAAALDLPDVDSLDRDSDFTAFMKKGVPAHLRNLALRKLWASDPALANLDGLIDYGEDFTDIKSGVFEAVKTVLDSKDEDGNVADRPAAESAEPETAQTDRKSEGVADDRIDDDTAESDREITVDDQENLAGPDGDSENAKA